jgi:hypothetical protein
MAQEARAHDAATAKPAEAEVVVGNALVDAALSR